MRRLAEPADEPAIMYTPPSRLSKSSRSIGWIIFTLALLARAACLKHVQALPPSSGVPVDNDALVEWGGRLAAGDWIGTGVFGPGPLYAYFLGLVFKLIGPGLDAPRLIQIVIGSATCVLIQRIGRQAFSPVAGLIAGLIAALYAPLLLLDVTLTTGGFELLLICAVIYQLLVADGSQRGLLATAGVCLALAALARDSLILLAPIIGLWLMIDPWLRGKMNAGRAREGLGRVGSFGLGLVLIVAPVAVRNFNVSGEVALLTSGGGKILLMTDTPSATHGLAVFLSHEELPDHHRYEQQRALLPVLQLPLPAWGWAAPAALAGLILSLARWREALVLYLIGGGYIGMTLIFSTLTGYRMPVVPVMILFAGFGVVEIATAMTQRRILRALIGVAALFAGIAIVNLGR